MGSLYSIQFRMKDLTTHLLFDSVDQSVSCTNMEYLILTDRDVRSLILFTSRLKRKKKTQTDLRKLFCEDRFEANSKEGKKQACCHLAIVHQVCKRKNRLLRMCISADTTCSASSCCLRNVFDDNCISFFFFFFLFLFYTELLYLCIL